MNKSTWMFVFGMGLIAAGCGKEQNQPLAGGPATTAPAPLAQVSEMKAPTQVTLPSVTQAVQDAAQTAAPSVEQTQKDVQQAASDLAQKAKSLLTEAQKYLDQGKLDEAINAAQNVLNFDPKNIDAQKIIETAKAKIKEMAEKKVVDLKSGLMNKLNSVGQ